MLSGEIRTPSPSEWLFCLKGGDGMLCVSGRHEWLDPISVERCCSGKWHRAMWFFDDDDDLDPDGRIYNGVGFVHGWARIPEDAMVI